VSSREAAELQVVLEGVDLPADKRKLIEYARSQDDRAGGLLQALPDREYRSLDEVGEALAPVQPGRLEPVPQQGPHEESGAQPGGDAYLDAKARPGEVRPSAPESNPPQKALEQQTKIQKQQQERQKQLG
jgi:hypothetical protein